MIVQIMIETEPEDNRLLERSEAEADELKCDWKTGVRGNEVAETRMGIYTTMNSFQTLFFSSSKYYFSKKSLIIINVILSLIKALVIPKYHAKFLFW